MHMSMHANAHVNKLKDSYKDADKKEKCSNIISVCLLFGHNVDKHIQVSVFDEVRQQWCYKLQNANSLLISTLIKGKTGPEYHLKPKMVRNE